jgi:hypothetical protein
MLKRLIGLSIFSTSRFHPRLKAGLSSCLIGVRCQSQVSLKLALNVRSIVMRLTLDIICETAFGYKANTLQSPHCDLGVACRTMSGLQSGTRQLRMLVSALISI